MDIIPLLRFVFIKEVGGHLCVHPAAREPERQIEYLHDGEPAPRILNVGKAHVCDACGHAVVHLDRIEECATGVVGDLHLALGSILHFVAKPPGEERHRVSCGEVVGGFQLDDIRPERKRVDR